MRNDDRDISVVDWVIDHPETMVVFQACGIDYCCAGKSLQSACQQTGVNLSTVLAKLKIAIEQNR